MEPKMSTMKKILLYLFLGFFSLLFLLPLGYALYNSLLPLDKVNQWVSVSFFSLDNYKDLFLNYDILRWFRNTIVMTIITLVGQLMTSLLGGYALAKLNFPGKKLISWVVIATLMIPFQVLITPLYIMVAKLGWHNHMLGLTIPFLVNSLYVFMARQFFLTLPDDLMEAARIDGLTHAGCFFRIALPLAKPVITTIIILNFTQSWNAYLVPSTFVSSKEMYTLVVGLNTLKDTYFNRTNLTMAGVVVITLPVLLLFLLLQKHFVEGIATSGIKE